MRVLRVLLACVICLLVSATAHATVVVDAGGERLAVLDGRSLGLGTAARVSSDGRRIAFARRAGAEGSFDLRVVDARGGPSRAVVRGISQPLVFDFAFDGRSLFLGDAWRSRLLQVDLRGTRMGVRRTGAPVWAVAASPDGRRVAFDEADLGYAQLRVAPAPLRGRVDVETGSGEDVSGPLWRGYALYATTGRDCGDGRQPGVEPCPSDQVVNRRSSGWTPAGPKGWSAISVAGPRLVVQRDDPQPLGASGQTGAGLLDPATGQVAELGDGLRPVGGRGPTAEALLTSTRGEGVFVVDGVSGTVRALSLDARPLAWGGTLR